MNIKKLTLTAFFAAIAVAGSLFSFPVLGSRCSPIQHLVNVMCAILLGPWYGLAAAFLAARKSITAYSRSAAASDMPGHQSVFTFKNTNITYC